MAKYRISSSRQKIDPWLGKVGRCEGFDSTDGEINCPIDKLLNKQRLPGVTGELKYDGDAGKPPVAEADKGEIFPGLLKNESEAVTLKIKLIRKEPGCDAVLTPEVSDEGFNLRRTATTKWVGLRIVKNTRAPLFSGPSLDKKTKAYFIQNNVLGVVSVHGDWINVEFPRDEKKMIKGWVRSGDVEDLQPPQKK